MAVPVASPDFTQAIDNWSKIALERGWAALWVTGAILPREMVFFLATCETLGVNRVIESGRQDGYSTMFLGEFADRVPGRSAISIDWEFDEDRARRCREKLAGFKSLELIRGNANRELPAVLRREPTRSTAVLVDGPKGFWALALLLSALQYPGVKIVSLHNLVRGSGYREYLEHMDDSQTYLHEGFGISSDVWRRLGEEEFAARSKLAPERASEPSTLGVVRVTDEVRHRSAGAFDRRFRLFQPPLVRLAWSLRSERIANTFFNLSQKVWKG